MERRTEKTEARAKKQPRQRTRQLEPRQREPGGQGMPSQTRGQGNPEADQPERPPKSKTGRKGKGTTGVTGREQWPEEASNG